MGNNKISEIPATYHFTRPADALFPGIRQRVLGFLFGQPERGFYTAELIRLVGGGSGAVQRELARLAESGLVLVSREGNRKLYRANPASPIHAELCGIAEKALTPAQGYEPGNVGVTRNSGKDVLMIGGRIPVSRQSLASLADRFHIKRLVLFGSAARGELTPDSDIDVLAEFEVGKAPSLGGLSKLRDELGQLFEGREVDLATPAILNNPYRRREIEKDMEVLYETPYSQ
ncbi:MAG: nucleotidyltransferase domain-containing protein [Gammaproteobacteria bacterium]